MQPSRENKGGRVCPYPCEAACNRKDRDGSVAINALERFVGDAGIANGWKLTYQLTRRGYAATVFESLSRAGGMLRYGIPQYRLPREILEDF